MGFDVLELNRARRELREAEPRLGGRQGLENVFPVHREVPRRNTPSEVSEGSLKLSVRSYARVAEVCFFQRLGCTSTRHAAGSVSHRTVPSHSFFGLISC